MPIPDLPGRLVPRHSQQESWLKSHVARMCHFDNPEKQVKFHFDP
jgi:mRNA guanylyltransferase